MNELDLNGVQLQNRVGVSNGTISNWTSGTSNPTGKNLLKLAEVLKCDTTWLASGVGSPEIKFHTDKVVGWDSETEIDPDMHATPLYQEVYVSAGCLHGEVHEETDRKIYIAKSSAYRSGAQIASSFSYFVDGESMADRISDGARCTADASKKQIKNGKIYCFRHGILRRTKYLHRLKDGTIRIESHNSDKIRFPDEFLSPDEQEDFEILGWVWDWSSSDRW